MSKTEPKEISLFKIAQEIREREIQYYKDHPEEPMPCIFKDIDVEVHWPKKF